MVKLTKKGFSKAGMCRSLGIAERSFFNWQAKARDGVEPFASLMLKVAVAEENYIHKIEQEVRNAVTITGTPDASARIALLKSRRDEWTTKVKVEAVREQVLSEFLDGLRLSLPANIYDEHVSPALLQMAGSPIDVLEVPELGSGEE